METTPPIELDTQGPSRASVIWLHGLGADGRDFLPIVPLLGFTPDLGLRFVFPHAPFRPVTINGGRLMRAWYDIRLDSRPGTEDTEGIRASQELLESLIENEVARGIPPEKVIIAGFSQGGAIALHTGLRYSRRIAGIMALSTYLPAMKTIELEANPANSGVSIFMAHGTDDAIIPLSIAQASRQILVRLGYPLEWHTYRAGHGIAPEEVQDIAKWLRDIVTAQI